MNLAELQHYFARAATSNSGPLPDLDRVFVDSERLSAKDRLAIYNRGYFYRLLDALASVFSQTKRLLGDSDFERLGLAYLVRYPSEHPAVERVGRSFSEYLSSAAAPAIAIDLASLEWARLCALVAPDPVGVATVHAVEPSLFPQARLRFVPSLHRLELEPSALSAFAGEQRSDADFRAADSPRHVCGVAVWRNQHAVLHQALDAPEWKALASAARGATLSHVCAVFDSGSDAEDVRRAFQVMSAWFARQWLEKVAYDDPTPI
ncbi:MAG: DNA-binding domain-containing protein [Pseudomonadota bacterium]